MGCGETDSPAFRPLLVTGSKKESTGKDGNRQKPEPDMGESRATDLAGKENNQQAERQLDCSHTAREGTDCDTLCPKTEKVLPYQSWGLWPPLCCYPPVGKGSP